MSGLLLGPELGQEAPTRSTPPPGIDDLRRLNGPPRRRVRALLPWLVGAIVGVVAMAAVVVPPVELGQAGPVAFDGSVSLEVPQFDARGIYSLRYVHGEEATIEVPLRNDGWLPTTVTTVAFDGRPAPMIEPTGAAGLPVTLGPGERATVAVRVRFDNCEYYTERAMDVYDGVTVTSRAAGIPFDRTIELDHQVVVRSPMMTTCPDRVSDRGAFLRGG